jgi:alkylation response protein AidB-like acyl-CoA dehydrogenase
LNFDFPDELKQLRGTARAFLAAHASTAVTRKVIDGDLGLDRDLWKEIGALGWLAATIPEPLGGLDMGPLAVCVLAEEIGRSLAPVPFSSVTIATEALLRYGSPEQKRSHLPKLSDGSAIGTLAWVEDLGAIEPRAHVIRFAGGRIDGTKIVVADGAAADIAIVSARATDGAPGLYLAELSGPTVKRSTRTTIDPSRGHADLCFDGHPAEPLPGATDHTALAALLDGAAVVMAFEQIGIASAALDMATAYAKQRYAFGRPIGSFQAIKHKLVDVYVALELARSNAYFAAWALSHDAPELPVAAAAARVSACEAAWLATKENIQTHGGMGFTWDLDCHLYYRRAKLLGLALGSATEWKRKLITRLSAQPDMATPPAATGRG